LLTYKIFDAGQPQRSQEKLPVQAIVFLISGPLGLKMPVATKGIKVQRSHGEEFRKVLVEMAAFDRSRKILSDESNVYLPVLKIDELAASRLWMIGDFEKIEMDFPFEVPPVSPKDLLGFQPSFEVIGDIAIVEDIDAERVASALMSTNKSIKVVIAPLSDVEGEFRTRRFRHVAGERGRLPLTKSTAFATG